MSLHKDSCALIQRVVLAPSAQAEAEGDLHSELSPAQERSRDDDDDEAQGQGSARYIQTVHDDVEAQGGKVLTGADSSSGAKGTRWRERRRGGSTPSASSAQVCRPSRPALIWFRSRSRSALRRPCRPSPRSRSCDLACSSRSRTVSCSRSRRRIASCRPGSSSSAVLYSSVEADVRGGSSSGGVDSDDDGVEPDVPRALSAACAMRALPAAGRRPARGRKHQHMPHAPQPQTSPSLERNMLEASERQRRTSWP